MSMLRRFENPPEAQPATPERVVPTGPGWWWLMGNHGPYIEEVEGDQNHALFLSISGSNVVDDGSWLAEVPPPAVCAAWVAAGRPSAAVLEALGEYEAARRRIVELAPVGATELAGPGEVPAAVEAFKAARERLNITLGLAQFAAIRADRAAKGGAA